MIDFSSRRLSREAVYIEAINSLSRTTVNLIKFKLLQLGPLLSSRTISSHR